MPEEDYFICLSHIRPEFKRLFEDRLITIAPDAFSSHGRKVITLPIVERPRSADHVHPDGLCQVLVLVLRTCVNTACALRGVQVGCSLGMLSRKQASSECGSYSLNDLFHLIQRTDLQTASRCVLYPSKADRTFNEPSRHGNLFREPVLTPKRPILKSWPASLWM